MSRHDCFSELNKYQQLVSTIFFCINTLEFLLRMAEDFFLAVKVLVDTEEAKSVSVFLDYVLI